MRTPFNRRREPQTRAGALISEQTLVEVKKKKKGGRVWVLAGTPESTDVCARLPPLFPLSASLWPPSSRLGLDTAS